MKSIRIASLAAAILVLPLAAHAQSNSLWQGPYAGINAGGLFSSTSATIGENNTVGGFSGNGSGFIGGAQAGYNWMVGPVMLGGEVDFQGSTETTNLFGGAGSSQIAATSAIPWFSTFRARVGYPVGSVMPYITGGAVWGHQTLSGFDPSQIPDPEGKQVVFACRSGRRSVTASQAAQAHGLPYDSHLAGGILAWKAAGLPTES